jgi:hypothetical protein
MLQLLLVFMAWWCPAGHSKQKVEVFADVYFPMGQISHGPKLSVDLNLPLGHGLCNRLCSVSAFSTR